MQKVSSQKSDHALWVVVAVLGFLSVLLGAFGAHALRDWLSPLLFNAFQTGTTYQFYHVFALALCLAAGRFFPSRNFTGPYAAFLIGIILFCGSLYLYAMTGWRTAALITPVGGIGFLVGWVWLAIQFVRKG